MSRTVLMIATYNFLTDRSDGGKQCSYRNYQVLSRIFGPDNVYLCMITNDRVEQTEHIKTVPAYKGKLQQVLYALMLRNGYSRSTEKKLCKYMNTLNYDYIWFDRSTLGRLCKRAGADTEKIVFFHNIEKKYIQNKIIHESIGYAISYPAFAYNEKRAVQKADKVIGLNQRDAGQLSLIYGRCMDCLLPISFADHLNAAAVCSKHRKPQKLLFLGSCFGPNVDGIHWFVKNVMPKLSQMQLIIVGKNMESKAEEWDCSNVKTVGTVEDVGRYYADADAVVLPVFYGAGMKVKTAEALMYGKVIFGTREALEGYETAGKKDIFECNSAEEFIESIRLYAANEKESFSLSNRQLFLDSYENEAIIKTMRDLLEV